MTPEPVFVRDGDRYLPSPSARGPWDPGALHGGAPAALFAHAIDRAVPPGPLALARLTCELVRPVPMAPLEVEVSILRPGRRVTLLEAVMRADGVPVALARALRVVPSKLGDALGGPPPFPGPEAGSGREFLGGSEPGFATHAMEIRFVEGAFLQTGPATAWFRLRGALVQGEPVSPYELVAAAGDFGNGIASEVSWEEHLFINPDLTLFIERPPRGDWVALQSQTRVGPGSVAMAESVLWDEHGRIGRAVQSLLVGRR